MAEWMALQDETNKDKNINITYPTQNMKPGIPKGTRDFPFSIENGIEPVYKELEGWQTDMTRFTSEDEFPQQFKDYIKFLETELETPITIISIGPDREQTIVRN